MAAYLPPMPPIPPASATHLFAITPSDTVVFTNATRAIWVGGAGNIAIIAQGDTAAVTISGVAAGTMLEIAAGQVMATNTTATLIVGMW